MRNETKLVLPDLSLAARKLSSGLIASSSARTSVARAACKVFDVR